ncbi:hypothetical protein H2509_18475 [Stappia sp. F7233]|uniref:Uncharacterized protein n=1 Tax=Stappia albiluteola TaxID=2758565 RepID=A0A839AJA8_9HYPH|nr:hypothetical protein [Stappia albiluteola]MBA5779118.1 hypothetical protein [Stappia albiluteola]
MLSERVRAALSRYMDERGISAANWCHRAGLNESWLYSFLRGVSDDFGAMKLIALADAENASIDEMLGRNLEDRMSVIDAALPILQERATEVSLGQIAIETMIPLKHLVAQFETKETLLIEAYLKLARDSALPTVARTAGDCLQQRMDSYVGLAAGWILQRFPMYLAFRSAILIASAAHRADYLRIQNDLAAVIRDKVLMPSKEISIPDMEILTCLSQTLYREMAALILIHGHHGELELIAADLQRITRAILTGKKDAAEL